MRKKRSKIQNFMLTTFYWKDCIPLKMKAEKKIQVTLKVLKHTTLDVESSPSKVSLENQFEAISLVVQRPFSSRHQSTSIILQATLALVCFPS